MAALRRRHAHEHRYLADVGEAESEVHRVPRLLNGATNVIPYRVVLGGTDGRTLLFSSEESSLFCSTATGHAGASAAHA